MINFANVKEWKIPYNGSLVDVLQVKDSNNTRVIWEKSTPGPDYTEPFYVENITSSTETLNIGKTISLAPTVTDIQYSTDKTNWSTLGTTSTTALTLTLQPNDKIYLRCATNQWAANSITGCSKVGGNIMSLLYGSNFTGQETSFPVSQSHFYRLFLNNTRLQDASKLLLPVTNLPGSTTDTSINAGCYNQMFYGCSSLTLPPVLPATTLTQDCYSGMFSYCTSLVVAPELSATTLAYGCYEWMFDSCTSLTNVSNLYATTLPGECYKSMFQYCTSLVNAPLINGTNLAEGCCNEMFINCTSLLNVHPLPATIMAEKCYESMFAGCTSLVTAPTINATTLARACFEYMFRNCTSLVNAPTLNVANLVVRCYYQMFKGCTLLNNIKCLATTKIDTDNSTYEWLNNVSANGTFTKKSGVTWPTGTSGIPSGWTVVEV